MDKNLVTALNVQLKEEINSAYLYLAMAADMEAKNWKGVAAWFKGQAQEEMVHAFKIYDYLFSRGERAVLAAIAKPQESWGSIKAAYEDALKHEQYITGCIHKLVNEARSIDDLATDAFLQWFVTEQVEEESTVEDILQKLGLVGDAPQFLFMLDRELGTRQDVQAQAT